jgi:hypothetical protein
MDSYAADPALDMAPEPYAATLLLNIIQDKPEMFEDDEADLWLTITLHLQED